jgi:lysozyme
MNVRRRILTLAIIGTVAVVFVLSMARLIANGIVWPAMPNRMLFPVRGIDVSHHQGNIDWEQVAADDIRFAYIKASEGYGFNDTRFIENWEQAREQGIITGAYHFYSLRIPGKEQAEHYISRVPVTSGTLPPAVDLEYGGNSMVRPSVEDFNAELNVFMALLEEHYGRPPIVYATSQFYRDYLEEREHGMQLWARDLFMKPHGLSHQWVIWQYHSRAAVAGIKGFVDLNVFNGTEQEFIKFIENRE